MGRSGCYYLDQSASGNKISSFHLEAGIAYWHCRKEDTPGKWEQILHYYNLLLQVNYAPAVALNRIYALFKARGKEVALREAEKLEPLNNHFYFTLLGELYSGVDHDRAKDQLERALSLAKTECDRQTIRKKIDALEEHRVQE